MEHYGKMLCPTTVIVVLKMLNSGLLKKKHLHYYHVSHHNNLAKCNIDVFVCIITHTINNFEIDRLPVPLICFDSVMDHILRLIPQNINFRVII